MTAHVDDPAAGGRRAVARAREDAVVARLMGLGTSLDGEPDPDYVARSRARLVAMAAVRSPGPARRPALGRLLAARSGGHAQAPRRTRLTAGLAGAALTVTALAALVAVSTGAGPGDALYGLKRGTEQTRLALSGDSRGEALLDLASTRLAELDGLLSGGASALPAPGAAGGGAPAVLAAGPSAALVVSTIATMNQETADGAAWLTERAVQTGSAAPVRDLATWAGRQSAGLAALQPAIPGAARPAAGQAVNLLDRIDARTAALPPALDCASGPATRGVDDLGPLPAACPAVAPSSGSGPERSGTAPGTPAPGLLPATGESGGAAPTPAPPGSGAATGDGTGRTGLGGVVPGTAGAPLGGGSDRPPAGGDHGLPLPTGVQPPATSGSLPLPVTVPPLLPGSPTGSSTPPSSPTSSGGVRLCLPPLVTLGNC